MKYAGYHTYPPAIRAAATTSPRGQLLSGLLTVVLALALAGCGNTPVRDQTPGADTSQQAASTPAQLLSRAARTSSPEKEELILQAAALYLERNDYNRARNALADIHHQDRLSDALFIQHTSLLGQIAIHDNRWILAHGILTSERLEQQWHQLPAGTEARLRELRAQAFANIGEIEASIQERIALDNMLDSAEAEQHNRDMLWRTLVGLPAGQLQTQARERPQRDVLAGWYELAAATRSGQSDLQSQQTALERWQAAWPGHPASRNLPGDLKILRQLIDNQPQKLALLLPTSGRLAKAGEAIRDGFFAAYYHSLQEQNRVPEILQYDSEGDIVQAYEQAVSDGAELIIGPVDKEKVAELALMPALPVPVLTLNYTDTTEGVTPEGFYQFGLAVEDEARQVARQAFLEGHRYALIMVPSQDWSERSARAFAEEWQKLGGTVVNHSRFPGGSDYSNTIKDAMLVEQSRERTRELRRIFGKDLQSQVRRRKDIDMIFMVADPVQARQIKPTLAFHYAGDLPVYSTSQIYSGVQDAKADRDLNGVRFNTLPWLFDHNSPEKKQIDRHASSSAAFSRLHALGADAFRLYPRLPQLAQVPGMRIYGATGALQLLDNGRVEREQIQARFRNGIAQPLPMVATGIEE